MKVQGYVWFCRQGKNIPMILPKSFVAIALILQTDPTNRKNITLHFIDNLHISHNASGMGPIYGYF